MREKQYKYETTKLKLIEMAARLPAGEPRDFAAAKPQKRHRGIRRP